MFFTLSADTSLSRSVLPLNNPYVPHQPPFSLNRHLYNLHLMVASLSLMDVPAWNPTIAWVRAWKFIERISCVYWAQTPQPITSSFPVASRAASTLSKFKIFVVFFSDNHFLVMHTDTTSFEDVAPRPSTEHLSTEQQLAMGYIWDLLSSGEMLMILNPGLDLMLFNYLSKLYQRMPLLQARCR